MQRHFSIIWGILILSSAFYARPLYRALLLVFPRQYVTLIVALLICGAAFLLGVALFKSFLVLEKKEIFFRLLQFFLALAAIIIVFLNLDLPEEKIHLILYALLGAFRSYELKEEAGIKSYLKAAALVLGFSICSELIQALLPDRFGDPRDVVVDLLSGISGILFYNSIKCTSR